MLKGIGKGGVPKAERLAIAESLWISGFKRWQVLSQLQMHFGISKQTAVQDFNCMRARLGNEASGITRIEKRDRVGDALLAMLRDPAVSHRDKLRALKQYAKLYALDEQPVQEEDERPDAIELDVPDWRSEYSQRLRDGVALSAGDEAELLSELDSGSASLAERKEEEVVVAQVQKNGSSVKERKNKRTKPGWKK